MIKYLCLKKSGANISDNPMLRSIVPFWLILLSVGVLGLGCESSGEAPAPPPAVSAALDSIQQTFIPDKRLAIWEVSLEKGQEWIVKGKTNQPDAKKALASVLDSLPLTLIDSVELVAPNFGLVTNSVSNLRSQPRHSSELSTQAVMGTPLKVYDQSENWYRVQTPDGYLGWMNEREFVRLSDQAFQSWQKAERVIYLEPEGEITSRLIDGKEIVTDVVMGAVMKVVDQNLLQYQVQLPDGRQGWIKKGSCAPFQQWAEEVAIDPEEVVDLAKTLMGRPYLWGGTSSKGMDCSGYTKSIFFQQGAILLRDASQQIRQGAEVATDTTWSSLEAGDFLFFGSKATKDRGERVTHVAIYLGAGKVIHATGRVKIESLNPGDSDFAQDRYDTFLRAKRMEGDEGLLRVADSWYF
jgi:SH3-like domain-containing protein